MSNESVIEKLVDVVWILAQNGNGNGHQAPEVKAPEAPAPMKAGAEAPAISNRNKKILGLMLKGTNTAKAIATELEIKSDTVQKELDYLTGLKMIADGKVTDIGKKYVPNVAA